MVPALYLDIHIPPLSTFTHSVPEDETTFAYILEGEGDTPNMPGGSMVGGTSLLMKDGGDTVSFTAGNEELRIVLSSGFSATR